jgi:hypothetical protein
VDEEYAVILTGPFETLAAEVACIAVGVETLTLLANCVPIFMTESAEKF